MPRPKKQAPNRADGRYEYKATVGKTFEGKAIRKSFYSIISMPDAKRQAEEYIVSKKVAETTGSALISKHYTFAEWAEKWLTVYKKPNVSENTYLLTYKNSVDKHLNPYFGKSSLMDIKSIDVQNFFTIKQAELSESMLDKLRITLSAIFETAIENDLCYKNPVKKIKYVSQIEKHEKRVYTDKQIDIAMEYFMVHIPEAAVMLSTGLRRGEVLGLMWSDINLANLTLSVNRSVADKKGGSVDVRPPKWGSYRIMPISKELAELLSGIKHTSEYVFPSASGEPQSPNTFNQRLSRGMEYICKVNAEMIPLTAHELRHTRGTQLRRQGVDIYTIQKIMGHKDINITVNLPYGHTHQSSYISIQKALPLNLKGNAFEFILTAIRIMEKKSPQKFAYMIFAARDSHNSIGG